MTEVLKEYMDKINITVNVPFQLPKLKKVEDVGTDSTPELPKLKLPKLKTVEV